MTFMTSKINYQMHNIRKEYTFETYHVGLQGSVS